jgi:hypothetical protein
VISKFTLVNASRRVCIKYDDEFLYAFYMQNKALLLARNKYLRLKQPALSWPEN